MVSPYLLKPLRALEEVLVMNGALPVAHDSAPPRLSPGSVSGTVAAILRRQGRISRPHVVWVNEPETPAEKPRKKD